MNMVDSTAHGNSMDEYTDEEIIITEDDLELILYTVL